MSGAHSISTRRAYGVQRVCRVWARPRSSVYAQRQAPATCARGRRRGPVGAASDEVLVTHIRRVLSASPFHGEGYRKAWAKDFDRNKVTNFIEGVARSSTRHGSRLGSAQSGPFATW